MLTKNFSLSEFNCKCGCGDSNISHKLVHKLQKAREIAGVSFKITSGVRCQMHNKKSGGLASSSHVTGLAADISTPDGLNRHKVLSGLIGAGFTRIGIAKSFIHADIDTSKPFPTIWLYS
jgi:zinc D-Ala-D-Ala carboxypeptidase